MNISVKERSTNFTADEIEKLKKLIDQYKDVLLNKKTDAVSHTAKEVAWCDIQRLFNTDLSQHRSIKQLKYKFDNLKKTARKDASKERQERRRTGGGRPDIPSTSCTGDGWMRSIIEMSTDGLVSKYDDDVIKSTPKDALATVKDDFSNSFLIDLTSQTIDIDESSDKLPKFDSGAPAALLRCPVSKPLKRGCCGSTSKRTIVGGWAWAWWLVTDVQRISLEVMTLNPMCEYVETAQGVPLTVTGVAQCKIMNEDELLTTACEQFLGKTVKEIKMTILQTLEGHLRAILGTLTVEEVYKDRDQFAGLVREVAAPDVGRMGIEILSFTIKDVFDDVQYLASLGRAQTAVVKRDANIGVAQANRDAGIREAECEKSAMDVKYSMDTKIEDNTRLFKLQQAQFDQEVNTAKAEAALAYELQAAKIKQKIRNEEIQIEIVERRKQIEVEQQEILRREEELVSTVRLPAEAEAYRLQTIAEGKRTQTVEAAKADAERIKVLGLAEATAIGDVGKADAERMLAKAKVYKQYGEAAIMALVLEALPKIAAEVSAPLAKTDEIVLVGDSGATGEVARLASGIPPALKTLTGLDLAQVMKRLHPATTGAGDEPTIATTTKKVSAF